MPAALWGRKASRHSLDAGTGVATGGGVGGGGLETIRLGTSAGGTLIATGLASAFFLIRSATAGLDFMISSTSHSPDILSSELDGTLAAEMPSSLAFVRTSMFSNPSFNAMSYTLIGISKYKILVQTLSLNAQTAVVLQYSGIEFVQDEWKQGGMIAEFGQSDLRLSA